MTAALDRPEPTGALTGAARRAIDGARAQIRAGEPAPTFEEIVAAATALLDQAGRTELQPVINATGVLLHTNLGRAPLGERQLDRVRDLATAYTNLEYDLLAGRRGNRYSHATRALTALTGAEAALVVNNNAAAVLLVLSCLCSGREVVISRGELIEIGGEFRIPDVMESSGARLAEVGTTNRTHLKDYATAIGPETAAILKVHPSNYKVVGFASTPSAREVGELARKHNVLLINDLGSGLLDPASTQRWLADEPPATVAIESGADIVTFSGDKLLGGPQAGIIVGRADLIARLARHPLLRALRVDKMTLAALMATLDAYERDEWRDLPLWAMATGSNEELEGRARAIADRIKEASHTAKAEAVPIASVAGGGSAPGASLGSWAVSLTHPEMTGSELERKLRDGVPPVIARVEDDRALLDVRTVLAHQDELLFERVVAALQG